MCGSFFFSVGAGVSIFVKGKTLAVASSPDDFSQPEEGDWEKERRLMSCSADRFNETTTSYRVPIRSVQSYQQEVQPQEQAGESALRGWGEGGRVGSGVSFVLSSELFVAWDTPSPARVGCPG